MKPFREHNQTKIGAISLAVVVLMVIAAFKADSLPLIGGGTGYHADFQDSSGIKVNDEVRIAGVRVGKVTGIDLESDHIRVNFKITSDAKFGPDTHAAIRVRTLLGSMYLALLPEGGGQMKGGATIPLDRTQSAYTVVDAFSGLAQHAEDIDLNQLKQALNTLSDAAVYAPDSFKAALQGVSELSGNLAARSAQINQLLTNLSTVSGTLGQRNADIIDLMNKSNTLMTALQARRDDIHRLLVSTADIAAQLNTLTTQSKADLTPALQSVQTVTNLLLKDQASLDELLRLSGPFYRVFANLLGNGPWFDTWIPNIPPT